MHIRKLAVALMGLCVLAGCATSIPPEVIANADYGLPPPKNYEAMIKAEFEDMLIDPTSPLYKFDKPRKGYTREAPMFNTRQTFGWRVCGTLNSKNRFGGYVGAVPFFVLFKDGYIAEKLIGRITDNEYGINVANSVILEACKR